MKCLVTGGAGFIASHLVDRLLLEDNQVRVIDNFSRGKIENLSSHKNNKSLEIITQDICSSNIGSFLSDIDVIFHLAALPRVQYSISNPLQTNETNITGTLNLLDAATKSGVKRFIYSSSSSVYGNQKTLPLNESLQPSPLSPYAVQKLTGEHYCKQFYLHHGLETICLRYFNVYGPRQDSSGGYACLIPKSINLVREGKSPVIFGDGKQTRDFTFVSDIVNANYLASNTNNPDAFGEVFNVGYSKNISVNYVVSQIIQDKPLSPTYYPPVVEPQNTLADVSKIKKYLNWSPQVPFETGIIKTIESFKYS